MIQNLCMYGLPFASRQNEMIEMALTFKFTGIEVDLDEMGRRAEAMGQDFATQFVNSANIEVASFKLPIDFGAEDDSYAAAKERLESLCAIAEAIDVKRCYAVMSPGSDRLAFQENFELHRTRINEIADRLATSNIRLGLTLNAVPSERDKFQFQFICKAEELLALIKSVGHANVGLALDTWNWQLGDGAMDQIQDVDTDQIVDVRFADLPEGGDASSMTAQDRKPPEVSSNSLTSNVLKKLQEGNYDGTISVVANFSDPNDRSRGVKTVERIRKTLNQLLETAGLSEQVVEIVDPAMLAETSEVPTETETPAAAKEEGEASAPETASEEPASDQSADVAEATTN